MNAGVLVTVSALLAAAPAPAAPGASPATSASAETNRTVELTFRSTTAYADPFNQVTLDVVFTDP